MGRELKFRAWDNVHGSLGDRMVYHGGECNLKNLRDFWQWISQHEPMPVMQYTGLKDVNGVNIYEGDVVKGQRYLDRPGQFARFIGAVEYDPWWGAYRRKGVKQYQGLDTDLRHGRELEVIGNIHANPELLERP